MVNGACVGVLLILVLQQLVCLKETNGNFLNPNPLFEAARRSSSIKKLDECFCELSGPVDVCCCDVETVDSLNHDKVHPLISRIIKKTYFRFLKINLNRQCPFWSDDGRCALKDCHVETCSEEEVPSFLRLDNSTPKEGLPLPACDEISEQEKILSTIVVPGVVSEEQEDEFREWSRLDDNFCHVEDDSSEDGSYIDLVLNPERYTGYSGHSPHRIWSAIYNENCFRYQNVPYNEQGDSTAEQCLEKRAFFRLISGLHSSINIHLSAEYILSGDSTDNPKFGPNLNEFVRRFDASQSNGQGPGWLKNLYFTYLVVLRAVVKGEGIWMNDDIFRTLNKEEDSLVRKDVLRLSKTVKRCGETIFDESQLFNGDVSKQLKEEFRIHFRNISRIMDCVGCDKCRLWGTIQVQGIGTALKLLFNGPPSVAADDTGPRHQTSLTRSEIVTLFNVLARLSESIEYLNHFKHMKPPSKNTKIEL